mmetsp:Transcript_43069/g.31446  ORF Transcript_43069/g.31446 Transcript_43069/m.31446 type:complete len:80 (-) Transcript_43069:836-1075(-)
MNNDSASTTKQFRTNVNLNNVTQLTLLEGEVIVAEGFFNVDSKFNANRIFKPNILNPISNFEAKYLKAMKDECFNNRAI